MIYLFFIVLLQFFCISSSDRALSLAQSRDNNAFLTLAFQAKHGNNLSRRAYQTYADILANNKNPRHIKDQDVINKLLSLGLCVKKNGKVKLDTYYIDDQISKIWKKK
jgi:hypothetical protein